MDTRITYFENELDNLRRQYQKAKSKIEKQNIEAVGKKYKEYIEKLKAL